MINMDNKSVSRAGWVIGFLGAAALSWLITCGFIKLITLCFGLTFSWAIATGTWLIAMCIRFAFNK